MTVPAGLPATLEHFIGGAHAKSADGATFEVADPVTNQPYATVAAGGPEDVDRAVAAAAKAFTLGPWPGWRSRPTTPPCILPCSAGGTSRGSLTSRWPAPA